ncbi:hypothetical protein ACJRO7_009885 [Eucalyptus globulus]|uniref:Nuclear pore protein n=1 Tax=Eucalyptus globulus TaxID=34317 RepID=A0ABD3LFP9_EUCGL
MEARKNVINNDFAEKESNCINGQSSASYLVWDDLTVLVPVGSKRKLLNQLSGYAQMGQILYIRKTLKLFECVRKRKILKSEALKTRKIMPLSVDELVGTLQSYEVFFTRFANIFLQPMVHEIAMVSAIQEAQKDDVRSFNDYMLKVLEDDWQKEKRDFLQSLSRISLLPKTNIVDSGHGGARLPQIASTANKSILEKKASVYGGVVKDLNSARERGLPFKPATAFKGAYESLGINTSGGKSVSMQKIWHLIQALMDEDSVIRWNVSKKMSLVIGARRHLEWGHEKYIMDMIQSHPAQAALGGGVGNLQRICAFLRIRLRDYGVLYFDVGDAQRLPRALTYFTHVLFQHIFFCLRTGYYNEARDVASHPVVSAETAATASEECEKLLRISDQVGRAAYDKKRLLLYGMISGSRRLVKRLLRDLSALFITIEDFLWFKLSAIREFPLGGSSAILRFQAYLNKFAASYYTKNGKDPLVYPYILLLSVQFLPAILYLSKEAGDEGYNIDATHIAIVLADHGVLKEGTGAGSKFGVMDAYAEASSMIQQYGSSYLHLGDLSMALEYYALGGGRLSWTGRANADQQRQRSLMLKHLLMELLLRDGGICFLLGSRGSGEESELTRFIPDVKTRQQFLLEAARQCLEAGIYDKSIEILKRIGAFSMALDTINKCLSDSICALSRGRLDGESQTAGLVHSGNEILETYKYSPEISPQETESVMEQQTVLRQLEAILSIYKLARAGHYLDALREVAKLPLDPRTPDVMTDVLQNLSPYVRACVPDFLKVSLSCMDNVPDSDGSLRALKAKIANFLANNLKRNWPRDLYEKVARSL